MGSRRFGKRVAMSLVVRNMNGATYAELAREHGCRENVVRGTVKRLRESIGLPDRMPGGSIRQTGPKRCALGDCEEEARARSKYCGVKCKTKNAHRRAIERKRARLAQPG